MASAAPLCAASRVSLMYFSTAACVAFSCFSVKKTAHYERIKADAEERGQTVITGKEAKEIMPN
ncbi:MAG: hypothetical protein EON54_20455, partial [Alcaligenaceae bacterium]